MSVTGSVRWGDSGRRAREGRRRLVSPAILALGGTTASSAIVLAGGRVDPLTGAVPPTRWLGLLTRDAGARAGTMSGFVLLGAVIALTLVWLLTVRAVRAERMAPRQVWVLVGCWSLPLVIGPPLLSGDVWTYAAQGLMIARHLDPYHVGPLALGRDVAVAAVDPRWRAAPSPYGPLASLVQWASVSIGGGALGGVVLLRLLAAASSVGIGALAVHLAPRGHRAMALAVTALNPLMLLHVVSSGHLEGLMGVLLLGAFAAFRRGLPQLALVLACAAAGIKAPALIAVAAVAVATVGRMPSGTRRAGALRCAVTAAASFTVLGALVPDGWGWVRTTLSTPAKGNTPAAVTSILTHGLAPLLSWTHIVTYPALAAVCRAVGLVAAAAAVVYLLATWRRRRSVATAGRGLLAVGLLGPVLYPWYVLWGGVCVAPDADGRDRDWLVALSAVCSTMDIPGLSRGVIVLVAVGVTLTALGWAGSRWWRSAGIT